MFLLFKIVIELMLKWGQTDSKVQSPIADNHQQPCGW